jgi:hypothetical protein
MSFQHGRGRRGDALPRHLDRVRVAQLMRREAGRRRPTRRAVAVRRAPVCDQTRPRVAPSVMHKYGPTEISRRCCRHGSTCSDAHSSARTSRRLPPLPWRPTIEPARIPELGADPLLIALIQTATSLPIFLLALSAWSRPASARR